MLMYRILYNVVLVYYSSIPRVSLVSTTAMVKYCVNLSYFNLVYLVILDILDYSLVQSAPYSTVDY